ncbi:SgcJ/EcaC family oxidoreductase [Ramlibacter tataouinensis]|uniref:YybH family protein n=1 Tax=Ramlibacter tataouinensis TaxID=94132 RepID=UPI0022F3E3C7|nr:SgcJ/EcaC family oxidoreductase [Ramlibacter tataouinensis]WBY02914.1 SgcJ/EcaC family oxidoreductase [Ramlibacter tataouinensis]
MAAASPQDVQSQWAKAFNSADLEGLMALYAPDACLVPQPGQPVWGHDAIREALQNLVALGAKIKLDADYVLESEDTALLRGRWHLTGKTADGQPLDAHGSSSEVVRRQPDGSWVYIIDHPYGAD